MWKLGERWESPKIFYRKLGEVTPKIFFGDFFTELGQKKIWPQIQYQIFGKLHPSSINVIPKKSNQNNHFQYVLIEAGPL